MTSKMDKAFSKAMTGCVLALASIIAMPLLWMYGVFANGVVGAMLWNWFVATTFQIPIITWWQGAGISLAVRYFVGKHAISKGMLYLEGEAEKDANGKIYKWSVITAGLLTPWVILLFAWVFKIIFWRG